MNISVFLLAMVFAIGFGSIPPGLLVAHYKGDVEFRSQGSGNIGATNIYRAFGWWWAIGVFVADVAKGFLAVMCAWLMNLPPAGWMAAGVVAVLANIFNPFLRGKGGKGVATTFGVMLFISPSSAVLALIVWAYFMFWKRIVSLASLVAAAVLPFAVLGLTWNLIFHWTAVITTVILVGLVAFAHRENIGRLIRREEKPPERIPREPAPKKAQRRKRDEEEKPPRPTTSRPSRYP